MYLSEDNLLPKIIFNNTGYLILMLGEVGYSPVVSPHRIKQVCKPYQVVKVATGSRKSVGSLDQWGLVSWQNCYDTVVFSLVLCIQLSGKSKTSGWYYCLLLCQDTDKSLCTDIKASVTKNYAKPIPSAFHAKRHWLDTLYPKGIRSLFGHQKFVRGRISTFASVACRLIGS